MSYLRCLSLCSTAVHGREPKWMPQRGSNSCCLRLCILPRWNWSNIFPRPLLVALCGAARFGVPPFASANLLDHCRCRPAHANGGQHERFGSLRQGTLALTLKSQHYLCDWSRLEHRKNTYSKCSRATANIWWFGFREFVLCRNESKRLCTICNCRKEQSFWDHSYLRKAGCVPVQLCRWAELTNAKCLGCPASDAFPPFGLAQGWLVTSPLVASAISSGSALPEPIADATARFFFFLAGSQCSLEMALRIKSLPLCGTKVQRSATLCYTTVEEGVKKLFRFEQHDVGGGQYVICCRLKEWFTLTIQSKSSA